MNCTSTVYENRLRQRIILLEDSVARVSSTRKDLRDNIDAVKNEVRSVFGSQLNRLRMREQQLLERLDTVASVKDEILSQQQDKLHQALGACSQGLQWLQSAYDDLKNEKLKSMESVERRIGEILNTFSSLDYMPRENALVSFNFDGAALRRSISTFGQVRSTDRVKNSESLPSALEDYDEDRHEHTMSHKSVGYSSKPVNMIPLHHPLSVKSDDKEWLMKEALTSSALSPNNVDPSGQQNMNFKNSNLAYSSEYLATQPNNPKFRHQHHIHSWLHQIKNTTENEPVVFEDFDISKKDQDPSKYIPVDMATNEAIFRQCFEMIALSPNNQWLIDKHVANKDQNQTLSERGPNPMAHHLHGKPGSRMDDESSCHSSFTNNVTGQFVYVNSVDPVSNPADGNLETGGMGSYEKHAEHWAHFLQNLWASADSMWLLPCASNEQPTMLVAKGGAGAKKSSGPGGESTKDEPDWMMSEDLAPFPLFSTNQTTCTTLPKNFRSPNPLIYGIGSQGWPGKLADQMNAVSLDSTFPSGQDRDVWLYRPPLPVSQQDAARKFDASLVAHPPPINERIASVDDALERALGWKAVLEQVHGMGDEQWLRKSVAFANDTEMTAAPACQISQ